MAIFVVHPDGTVDYPDTGCFTMSAEEFAAADTRQAWSQAEQPPEPQPYYEPLNYEPTYHEPPHEDWMRVLKLVSCVLAGALVIAAVIVLVTSLTKPLTPTNPTGYATATATRTVTATALPTTATQTVTAIPAPTQTVTAAPVPIDSEQQLRQIATGDRPFVSVRLADRWVPQLSAKRPGVVDQGIVWDDATTLREHLQLRERYHARLLWSGEWSTFSTSNFWVTLAGITFPTSVGALEWCASQGFDRDHCFAKIISTTRPVEGSTAYNK
jgi:serine/threonine-protein kinase